MPADREFAVKSAEMGPAACLLITGADREAEAFDLLTASEIPGVPWPAEEPLPERGALDFWGVEPISIADAGQLAQRPVAAVPDPSHLVVALGDCAEEARLFASRRGRSYAQCGSWEEVVHIARERRAETVTVVVTTETLSYGDFHRIVEEEDAAAPFGFLTGTSRGGLRWSLLKALLLDRMREGEDLFLCGQPGVSEPALFEGMDAVWWDEFSGERVARVQKGRYVFSALISHSNGVDGNFSSAILCPVASANGAPPRASAARPKEEGLPSCLSSSLCQRDPEGKRHRFYPGSIRTAIALYDTCAGLLTAGAFSAHDASLGAAFLAGPCAALVTTFRKKASTFQSALLARALLRDGHPLGEVVRQLNRFQRSHFGELPSFILLGDPAYRLSEEAPATSIAAPEGDKVMLSEWRGHSARLALVNPAPAVVPTAGEILTVNFAPRDGAGEWWVFRSRAQAGTVRFRAVDPRAALESVSSLEIPFRRNLAFLEVVLAGLRLNGARELEALESLLSRARGLLPAFDALRQAALAKTWTASSHDAFVRQQQALIDAASLVNRGFPAAWRAAKQWVVLHHHYTQSLDLLGEERVAAEWCPACGSGMTTRRSGTPHLPGIIRAMFTCVRCGVVADVPDGAALPVIAGPARCAPGEAVRQRVTLPVDTPETAGIEVLAYFGGFGADVVRCDFDPPSATARRGPKGAEAEIRLSFASDCPPGLYSLVVVGSSLLTPMLAAKYVSVEVP